MNVETAVVTHAYLCAAVDELAKSRNLEGAIRGTGALRDYKLGAAERIYAMVLDFKSKAEADPSIGALVRIGREVSRRAYDAEFSCYSPPRQSIDTGFSDENAHGLGYSDGSKIDPHGARSSRLLS